MRVLILYLETESAVSFFLYTFGLGTSIIKAYSHKKSLFFFSMHSTAILVYPVNHLDIEGSIRSRAYEFYKALVKAWIVAKAHSIYGCLKIF